MTTNGSKTHFWSTSLVRTRTKSWTPPYILPIFLGHFKKHQNERSKRDEVDGTAITIWTVPGQKLNCLLSINWTVFSQGSEQPCLTKNVSYRCFHSTRQLTFMRPFTFMLLDRPLLNWLIFDGPLNPSLVDEQLTHFHWLEADVISFFCTIHFRSFLFRVFSSFSGVSILSNIDMKTGTNQKKLIFSFSSSSVLPLSGRPWILDPWFQLELLVK